jgi:hypothetical protein
VPPLGCTGIYFANQEGRARHHSTSTTTTPAQPQLRFLLRGGAKRRRAEIERNEASRQTLLRLSPAVTLSMPHRPNPKARLKSEPANLDGGFARLLIWEFYPPKRSDSKQMRGENLSVAFPLCRSDGPKNLQRNKFKITQKIEKGDSNAHASKTTLVPPTLEQDHEIHPSCIKRSAASC